MEHEIQNEMINIKDPVPVDNSVTSYEYEEFLPSTKSNYNDSGHTIQIDIQAGDSYFRPADSYIYLEGYVAKADNNRYAANDQIALVNNAMMYLFNSIEYSMGGNVVETLINPGHTTSMLGYLTYPDDFNTSAGLMQCWSKDSTINADSTKFTNSPAVPAAGVAAGALTPVENPNYNIGFATRRSLLMSGDQNTRGNFSFTIPFSHIFGFSEYDKILYNVKHTLKFTRGRDNLAIHAANNVAGGKVVLTDITWNVPSIEVSTINKAMLMKGIVDRESYPVYFSGRSDQHTTIPQGVNSFDWRLSVTSGIEKPRWIIVGFQTDKNETQTQNPAVFDHLNLDRAHVRMNNTRYPRNDVSINFSNNCYTKSYKTVDKFKQEYYKINNLVGGSQINLATYKSLFPLIVFDAHHQNEELKSGVVDIQLKFFFSQPIPANTEAFAVILSDRLFKLSSDGTNMKMLTF